MDLASEQEDLGLTEVMAAGEAERLVATGDEQGRTQLGPSLLVPGGGTGPWRCEMGKRLRMPRARKKRALSTAHCRGTADKGC